MSIVPAPERIASIGSDYVDTWPSHCPPSCSNCTSCWISGKIQCSPRFWLSGLYGFYWYSPKPASKSELIDRRAYYDDALYRHISLDKIFDSLDNADTIGTFAAHPLVELPDGGFASEMTERVRQSSQLFRRRDSVRYTDIPCPHCGKYRLEENTFKPATGHVNYCCSNCGKHHTPSDSYRRITDRYGYDQMRVRSIALRQEGKSAPVIASVLQVEFGLDIYTRTILRWVKDIPYTDQSGHNRVDTTAQRLRAIQLRGQHYTVSAIAGKLKREYGERYSRSTIYLWTKDTPDVKRVYRQQATVSALPSR